MKSRFRMFVSLALAALAAGNAQAGDLRVTLAGDDRSLVALHRGSGALVVTTLGDGGDLWVESGKSVADTEVLALGSDAGGRVTNRAMAGAGTVVLGMCPRGTAHPATILSGTRLVIPRCE